MKLITRDADYAIRAVTEVARKGENIVTVNELIKELKVPKPFLRKLMQVLNREGVIKSYKGRAGGFKLVKSPKKVSVLDLVEIFQGKFQLSQCMTGKRPCPNRMVCKLRKKLSSLERATKKELQGITIGYLTK